jgi:hypothetical protein
LRLEEIAFCALRVRCGCIGSVHANGKPRQLERNWSGLMAAAIAVFGFLSHAWPVIAGRDETAVRRATVVGGLGGFVTAVLILTLPRML